MFLTLRVFSVAVQVTGKILLELALPVSSKIEAAVPSEIRAIRSELIVDVGLFGKACIANIEGFKYLAEQMDDMYILLTAGEPDTSEKHIQYNSKIVKDAISRLEASASCFHKAVHSKAGKVLVSDADREFRRLSSDGVGHTLMNNIIICPDHLGLCKTFFDTLVSAGWAAAYNEHRKEDHVMDVKTLRPMVSFIDTSAQAIHQAITGWSKIAMEEAYTQCVGLVDKLSARIPQKLRPSWLRPVGLKAVAGHHNTTLLSELHSQLKQVCRGHIVK